MLDGGHRIERQTMVDRERDPFERQQPLFRDHAARSRKSSWSAAGSEHAVARDCDQEGIATERLAHGPRRAGLSQQRRDLPIGGSPARGQAAHLFVDCALERGEHGEIELESCEVLRVAGEVTLEEARGITYERRYFRPVLL